MNPLFNKFGRNNQNGSNFIPNRGPQSGGNNFFNLMNRFQQFKNGFQGDPRAQVQQLLDSGQMTQEQFEQLSQMAQQFQGMMGKK